MNPLSHFELGYDRDYIGIGLHCLLCPGEPDDWPGRLVAATRTFGDNDNNLAAIVQAARDHLTNTHSDVEC